MKNVIIIGVLALILLGFGMQKYSGPKDIEQVRVAYSIADLKPQDLDPASIQVIQQALLIDNIYSHLVEFDDEGQLQPGIAKSFYWQGKDLVFEFSDRAITKSGHVVDAEDAAFSIQRALKLGKTTHSDLIHYLCGSSVEVCNAVRAEAGKLHLTVSKEKYKPFVLQTMAADDFVIVPKKAVDPKTLAIIDYTESSGPYYIESATDEKWILRQNSRNYCVRPSSPNAIILVSTAGSTPSDMFIEDKVDILTTLNNIGKPKFAEIQEKVKDFDVSKTLDIKLYYLQFSPKAQKKFTFSQRALVANKIRQVMADKYSLPIFSTPVNRFFLDQSTGRLTPSQSEAVDQFLKINSAEEFKEKVTFYYYTSIRKNFEVFDVIKEIQPVDSDVLPFSQKIEDRHDLFMATTDTSYGENQALLNYNFTQGTFGLNREEGSRWLEEYSSKESLEDRNSFLQDLHYEALKSGVLFPVYKAPYTSLGRNGFKLKLSPLFASTHFWKIERH